MTPRRRRLLWIAALLLVLAAASRAILTLPLTTLQGVNYQVRAYRIPAYVKAIDFVQRHYQHDVLASRICEGIAAGADCVLALFDWTHRNIRPTPDGWPVVDDHPINIVIRGHGKSDQIADVFTTLSVYAGVPAFLKFVIEPDQRRVLVLSFAYLGGKWVVFDVERHIAFRNRQGELASVDELAGDPALVDAQTSGLRPADLPYSAFISKQTLLPFVVPAPVRGVLHQPWPRLRYELRRAVGWSE
jgi:hypothetical protein